MSSYHAQVQNLHYNAAAGAFEALVVLHEGADERKFPCTLNAPIDTPFERVSSALVAQAKAARKRGTHHLVAHARVAARKSATTHVKTLARSFVDNLNLPGPAKAA